jgi:two-component system, LytTR family, response regulator
MKAVIIDDEKKSREVLKTLVEKNNPQLIISGMADGVQSGIKLVQEELPDIIFLDIKMADGTGFDLLESLPDLKSRVIFTTAYDQFALKAIKYSALDYLMKPIDSEELKAAIEKAEKQKAQNPSMENLQFLLENFKKSESNYSRITLPTGNAYEVVNISDIIRCEAETSYTKFVLAGKRNILVSSSLKYYEDLLPEKDFFRLHHHHLVNLAHVQKFLKEDGGYVIMSDGSKIEISRRKKEAFIQRLHKI